MCVILSSAEYFGTKLGLIKYYKKANCREHNIGISSPVNRQKRCTSGRGGGCNGEVAWK